MLLVSSQSNVSRGATGRCDLPTGNKTTEGTCNSDRSCKDSQARGSLGRLVPITEIHDDTGPLSALCIALPALTSSYPGKKPASAIPRKKRIANSPAKLCTAAVQIVMIPQLIIIRPIHTEGEKYFIAKLLGASKRT